MKVVTVVGARPQFIKAAPVSRELRREHQEVLLHTGQHYDYNMSQLFFEELDIPAPDIYLGIGSVSHGEQTARMLTGIEQALLDERPDWVLVYGDTNSTLAGALAAVKLNIPIAHIEAGLRSYNWRMPEEVNRVVADRISDLLFCPTNTAIRNLEKEGLTSGVHLVGDVMYDAVLHYTTTEDGQSQILQTLGLEPGVYLLATIHRPYNTDVPDRLQAILDAFRVIGDPVVFPVHPRTRQAIDRYRLEVPSNVHQIEPVGYLDMLGLEKCARAILTDSGGMQKEAYWFAVPCVTLREETEWVETVDAGWNQLVGCDSTRIIKGVRELQVPAEHPPLFGDGQTAGRIVGLLNSC